MSDKEPSEKATRSMIVSSRSNRVRLAGGLVLGSSLILMLFFLVLFRAPEAQAGRASSGPGTTADYSQPKKLAADAAPTIAPGRLIIKYGNVEPSAVMRSGPAVAAVDAVLEGHTPPATIGRRPLLPVPALDQAAGPARKQLAERLERRQAHHLLGLELVQVPESVELWALCRELEALPEVEYAHPDYVFSFHMVPNDPYYHSSNSWGQGYDDLYGPKLLDCAPAWDLSQGQDVVVAVVDSGVDYNHPDLAANLWLNPPEDINGNGTFDPWPSTEDHGGVTGDFDGVDNDANGYVDDVIGYDFAGDGEVGDPDPKDGYGHGTHVAGTIAAVGNNALGVIGIAPQARIMAVKISIEGGSQILTSAATEAVVYLADNGAQVDNNSWGGFFMEVPELKAAFQYAADADIVNVASAGNSDTDAAFFYPVSWDGVIGVAATDHNDIRAYFSNYGRVVDVSAPGGGETEPAELDKPHYSVLSLLAAGSSMAGTPYVVGGQYLRAGGTSMAAPHVSGVAALLRSHFPAETRQDVCGRLKAGADSIDHLNPGYAGLLGAGRVNAYQSLTAVPQPYLELAGVTPQDPMAPGQTFELVVAVRNEWMGAHNAQFTLTTTEPLVSILQSSSAVGDIAGSQTVDNASQPFEIHLDPGLVPGTELPFELNCQYDEGAASFPVLLAMQVFQNVIAQTGLPVTGQSSITLRLQDLDGDDYPEALVSWAFEEFRLFANQQDGSFAQTPLPLRVHSVYGLNAIDLDDDGLRDIVSPGDVVGSGYRFVNIYRHLGQLQFEVAPQDDDLDFATEQTLALDFNNDRLPDLLCVGTTSHLVRNDGDFAFTDVSGRLPGTSLCGIYYPDAVLSDYDNDNHPDIIVAGNTEGLTLLRNLGDGTFEDASAAAGIPSFSATDLAVGDFDNDGWMDIFVGDRKPTDYTGSDPANRLFHNNGDGTFADMTPETGDLYQIDPDNHPTAYRGSECFDYDNDGDLDIFVQCGDNNTVPTARLYRNNGGNIFTDVTAESLTLPGGVRYTAAYDDYDHDGDVDMYLSDSFYGAAGFFENYASSLLESNHWIRIRLFGIASNRDAFGARVTVVTGAVQQIRDVTHSELAFQPLHFGLGGCPQVDEVIIRWPAGTVEHYYDVAADRIVTFVEGGTGQHGDLDGDGDVDLVDFATFANCFGLSAAHPPSCPAAALAASDLDGDGDVDLRDFATFAMDFTG